MVELKDCQQLESEGKLQSHSCPTLMAQVLVPWWIQFYPPSGKTIQWCLGSSSFSLAIDDTVAWINFWTAAANFGYHSTFYVQVPCLKNSTSSNKENLAISRVINLLGSSVTSFLWTPVTNGSSLASVCFTASSMKMPPCRSRSNLLLRDHQVAEDIFGLLIHLLKPMEIMNTQPAKVLSNHSWWEL